MVKYQILLALSKIINMKITDDIVKEELAFIFASPFAPLKYTILLTDLENW